MDGRTFIDSSHRGAMAVRSFVDLRSEKPRFDWYQQTYANTILRRLLTQYMPLVSRRLSRSRRVLKERIANYRTSKRRASLGEISTRWATFDRDTLNQINRLLDGKLPDAELQGLGEKIGDIIGQLDVSSPQRNTLVALFNYINAQGSIVLGYTEDVLTPRNQSGDVMPAIGWPLWSVPSTGFPTWGIDFVRRIQYVSSQGGDITFILPEGEYGYTFTVQGVFTSYCIWKEVLRQIDSMGPSPDYQFMLSGAVAPKILSKINDHGGLKNLYAYHIFRQAYEANNRPYSPIANSPIDKSTIGVYVNDAIQALADKNLSMDNQLGATSHFEFTYLLWIGIDFKMIGSEEKIQSFMEFLLDESDPDAQEFHDRLNALMALPI